MPSLDEISAAVKNAIQNLPDGQSVQVTSDSKSNSVRIFGKRPSPIETANFAVQEILELAYANAEHHPYWSMLYHCSSVSQLLLEAWESQLTPDQKSEIRWRCEEILATIDRVS